MGHKVVFLNLHSLHTPNDSTSHIESIFRHACHARKAPASPSLMLSPELSFSNSISISVSLDDSCMPTLIFFEDLLLSVPNSLFIAGFFDSENDFFYWHSRNSYL